MDGRLDYLALEFMGGEAVFQCLPGVIYCNLLCGINRVRCCNSSNSTCKRERRGQCSTISRKGKGISK